MVSEASRVTVRVAVNNRHEQADCVRGVNNVHEGLRSVLALRPVKAGGGVVDLQDGFGVNIARRDRMSHGAHLHEDTRQGHGEVGVIAGTTVGSTGGESDVRLVVIRIHINAIPTLGEVLEERDI